MARRTAPGTSGRYSTRPVETRNFDPGIADGAGPPAISATRPVGRYRALPTGRAVVGAFLIAAAAVVVFSASIANAGRSTERYVVSARALSNGAVIGPADLSTAKMQLPAGSRSDAFRDPTRLIGRTVAIPISAGELLQTSMLTPATSAVPLRPVSIGVDPASLDSLNSGQAVDVLETLGSDVSTRVSVVVRGAILIDVNRGSSSVLSGPSTTLVTVGVATLAEVESVEQAAHAGTIALVAAVPSDGVGPGPGPAGS